MSQQLINRSEDLARLRQEGYDIEIRSGHLLIKGIPYVNSGKVVRHGTLVVILNVAGEHTAQPHDHVAYFIGEYPCRSDGTPIEQIKSGSGRQDLAKNVMIDHTFSARPVPDSKYRDYYHKVATYVGIISTQAHRLDPEVNATCFQSTAPAEEASIFEYVDTASSRARIGAIVARFEGKKVAIIGVGGTGSYVLDLVAKTPVSEIHLFDGDSFGNHNAFRSPGAANLDELNLHPSKVEYFKDKYSKMHRGIHAHYSFLGDDEVELLRAMDFVFLCFDRGGDKQAIVKRLEEWGKEFIDVGVGINLANGALRGGVRVTLSTPDKRDHFPKRVGFGQGDADNEYARNIQIAELNALNAALAVIKWKQLWGFYQDGTREHFSYYSIDGNEMTNCDSPCAKN